MQCAAGIAVQILVLWRSGFQELKRQLATCGGHRMRKQAAVGAQGAEISHDAVEDPAVGPAAGRPPRMSLPGSRRRPHVLGGAFLAGFVPDDLTGILAISQGFSELLGSVGAASIPFRATMPFEYSNAPARHATDYSRT